MKSSVYAKTILSYAIQASGVLSKIVRSRSDKIAILMYHRILPSEKAEGVVQSGMYVDPTTFDSHLCYLKRNFEIIPICRYFDDRESGGKSKGKPRCILTFDDGWRDFIRHAYPILIAHQTPATVFLPTDFIGSRERFWTDRLNECLMGMNGVRGKMGISDDPLAARIQGMKGTHESRLEEAIRILKGSRNEVIEQTLRALEQIPGCIPRSYRESDFLTWEEVRVMGGSGFITFGSHTARHRILTTLTHEEIRDELRRSRDRLLAEKAVCSSFIPFCYPDGRYRPDIVEMVESTGYSLAVTTEGGMNGTRDNRYGLKRIAVHEDMTRTQSMFGCRIVGIL